MIPSKKAEIILSDLLPQNLSHRRPSKAFIKDLLNLEEFVYGQKLRNYDIKKEVHWRADTNIQALEGISLTL